MKANIFPFNPLGCYSKKVHDMAKEKGIPPIHMKMILNSVYGNTNFTGYNTDGYVGIQ